MYLNKFSRCFLLSSVLVLLLLKPSPAQVVCPGAYGGHLQGIAIDDNNSIYWSFTVALVKTDETGNILAKVDVPNHHGDLTTKDGKVYVAVWFTSNNKARYTNFWIYVYDAKDLKLISKHSVPEAVHGAGGVGHHKGHFFVVGGLPKGYKENYVYEYDKNFKFLKRHVIKSGYTDVGIQTVCFSQGCWWFGCYGSPSLLKTDESFQMLGKYNFDCALGIDGLPGDRFLIGRGKKGGRGQVLIAKMDRDNGLIIVDEKLK